MKEFLPVGSVVRLKNEDRLFAIAGFCQGTEDEDAEIFDYSAVPYPYGYLNADNMFMFNDSDIGEVLFTGYLDDLGKTFSSEIVDVTDKVRRGEIQGD
ncbi:DUF4176 domain-containing protein [Butyrivibrio sp. JL13D10]|uniref:DUF4176 domain-containing protein n=1 Tax=Butyrivibrio sp. JL13D10 TaxID=3236815 RepID=UPI0038B4635F